LKKNNLHQCAIIGFQTHFTPNAVIQFLEEKNVQLIRLGKARQQLDELEPTLRDTDLLSLNLAALKYADAPSQITPSVTGFWAEEICQLVRFAGASDRVSSFGIYGFEQKTQDITAQTVATIIWYFLDGFFNRQNDLPIQNSFTKNELENLPNLTEYIVTMNELGIDLSFYKSRRSMRWWVQIPNHSPRKDKGKIKLVAVSYGDYLQACQGNLSERLFNFFK
jgi:formiminoglutamase